ncbi:MAG: hypothetical protein NT029_00095 [Armatimonadetes bacterium]|nr:hypothetical protein [Armatimonadota bacterium]
MASTFGGRTAATVSARGYRTSFGYDLAGRQAQAEDAFGHLYSTVHHTAGRAVASVDPLGYRTSVVLDAAGRRN